MSVRAAQGIVRSCVAAVLTATGLGMLKVPPLVSAGCGVVVVVLLLSGRTCCAPAMSALSRRQGWSHDGGQEVSPWPR